MLSSKEIYLIMVIGVQNTTISSADGSKKSLGDYSGSVLLIVNVASYCGNTAQYADLQKLHELYSQKGLIILAFPCNDFGNQEPDSLSEIKNFCSTRFEAQRNIADRTKQAVSKQDRR